MQTVSCPLPIHHREVITLAHGGGGQYTHQLLQDIILPAFQNDALDKLHDGAFLHLPANRIIFTTDSYVIQPIFFPGGDIGKLAVTGTLNDLAMCGAIPYYLSCSFIIEEGFPLDDLKKIIASMKHEADAHRVHIVTGDTKVIERRSGANIFINTSGIGILQMDDPICPQQIRTGDKIVLSGDIARHGMAIMAQRDGFDIEPPLASDCASLVPMVQALVQAGVPLHCLRDLTRGGLATALVELAESSQCAFRIDEEAICVSPAANSVCELLGFDPLYVANEGRFAAFVPEEYAELTLKILRQFPEGEHAALIGEVLSPATSPSVTCMNAFGSERFLYRLIGEQLPRIC